MQTTDVREPAKDVSLAIQLYQAGRLSLGKAASVSGLSVGEFINHVARRGIEIVRADETVTGEPDDLSAWLRPQGAPGR